MNESGHNFEELKRLLKVKRHEVPPPGYFSDFSSEVISRIRDKRAGGNRALADQLEDKAPWLLSFLRIFEAKPTVIGAFATSLCLLLVFGVVLAERSDSAPQTVLTTAFSSPAETPLASSPVPAVAAASAFAESSGGGITVTTNASLQPVVTMFGQPGSGSLFQPVSFSPAGK